MRKKFLRIGSFVLGTAVILGAFGAHGLQAYLDASDLSSYDTAVQYQFYHGFAILIVAITLNYRKTKLMNYAAWSFFIGILLFSGSLYYFTFAKVMNIDALTWVGPVTPLGGMLFIIGWILFFISTFQDAERSSKRG